LSLAKTQARLVLPLLLIAVSIIAVAPIVTGRSQAASLILDGDFSVSVTMRVVNVLLAKTFTLPGNRVENNFCSTSYSGPFYANAGQLVKGTLVSTQPINFYIISSNEFSTWDYSSCQGIVAIYGGSEYGGAVIEWNVPTGGGYFFLFTSGAYNDASIAAYITLYSQL
jgi:hypothetical protein